MIRHPPPFTLALPQPSLLCFSFSGFLSAPKVPQVHPAPRTLHILPPLMLIPSPTITWQGFTHLSGLILQGYTLCSRLRAPVRQGLGLFYQDQDFTRVRKLGACVEK